MFFSLAGLVTAVLGTLVAYKGGVTIGRERGYVAGYELGYADGDENGYEWGYFKAGLQSTPRSQRRDEHGRFISNK